MSGNDKILESLKVRNTKSSSIPDGFSSGEDSASSELRRFIQGLGSDDLADERLRSFVNSEKIRNSITGPKSDEYRPVWEHWVKENLSTVSDPGKSCIRADNAPGNFQGCYMNIGNNMNY